MAGVGLFMLLAACGSMMPMPLSDAGAPEPDAGSETPDAGSEAPDAGMLASNEVGPAGGTVRLLDGAVTLVFPAGAVSTPTVITATARAFQAPRFPQPVEGTAIDLGPSGISFAVPVRLIIRFDATKLTPGTDVSTLHIGKSVADGWESFESTVDEQASTVSAQLRGFSSYGVIPGLVNLGVGGIPGMRARLLDWPTVRNTSLAVDPSGALYVAGTAAEVGMNMMPRPILRGSFLARFNADLSVQWVRPLPNLELLQKGQSLVVDQQGNASVGSFVRLSNGDLAVEVTSLNPSGSVRAGFPVRWNRGKADAFVAMAVDSQSNLHVYSTTEATRPAAPPSARKLVYTVLSRDGAYLRAPWEVPSPGIETAFSVFAWDIVVDSMGNPFFTVSIEPTSTSNVVYSVLAFTPNTMGDLVPRSGFPMTVPFAQLFARPVTSLTNTPTQRIFVQQGARLGAINLTSGMSEPGFPVDVSVSSSAPTASAVDDSGNVWMTGSALQMRTRVWLSSHNSSGQRRSGFPRIFALNEMIDSFPDAIAIAQAGTAYLSVPQGGIATGRYLLVRQPAQ